MRWSWRIGSFVAPPAKHRSFPSSPQEGQRLVALLRYCSSSHSWLCCSSAGGSIPSVPSQYTDHSMGCVLGEKNGFSKVLIALGGYLHSEGKLQNNWNTLMRFVCLVFFFPSLIAHIKGEYFFSQYTFQQTILSNHQRWVLSLKTYAIFWSNLCFFVLVVWGIILEVKTRKASNRIHVHSGWTDKTVQ